MVVVGHFSDPARRRQQRLARDAASIDTRTTDVASTKDAGLEALAPRVQRGAVAADAAADDDHLCANQSVRRVHEA